MIYQWNGDLNVITKQTEESKRVGEILEGLKLGGANSKGGNIPSTLNSNHIRVDLHVAFSAGYFGSS
jgi:hypothetical protein